jgi:hypothetical protein
MADRFYGKFRGVVRNDRDPLGIGRLQVAVPDVLAAQGAWAMPCLPFTRPDGPAIFALPAVDISRSFFVSTRRRRGSVHAAGDPQF